MTTWTPILSPESETAVSAWQAVQAITEAVMAKENKSHAKSGRPYEEALLYGYLALAHDDLQWATRATERLNVAIDEAGAGYLGLFGGLAGLGWTVEHLSHRLQQVSAKEEEYAEPQPASAAGNEDSGDEDDDLNAEIDDAILKAIPPMDSTNPYDLISGLVGYGTYFLERLPRTSAIQGIKAVFESLDRLSERNSLGITWHSGPELLPDWQRKLYPEGYYNLGVAHGIPGIIFFLSEVSATGVIEGRRSGELLEGAMKWLLAQQRPRGSLSCFSSWVAPGQESTDGRLAWCYGDLGIVAVLLQVARRAGRRDWQQFVRELLDHCLAWPPDQTGAADAPLCHGAAGLAHIFNRIYQSEGDDRCRQAARFWYERVLAMRRKGEGAGGFLALTKPDAEGPIIWEASTAFLDGALGIALTLLSALTQVEPAWDRMLLVSGGGERICRARSQPPA